MGFFKRGKKGKGKGKGRDTSDTNPPDPDAETVSDSSPQSVGVVSGVLSTGSESGEDGSLFGDIVERRFGQHGSDTPSLPPQRGRDPLSKDSSDDSENESVAGESDHPTRDHLRAVEPLFPDDPATPDLEVDLMAHIGRATTITGNIVAEEDLEIQGTVEGSVRLANHQVTIGAEGHVKASVDAENVMVYGKITGDVVASDLVEVEKGGIVGGDIKAPRIIMHDGAIVVGGLDMSASLPNGGGAYEPPAPEPARPHLMPVTNEENAAEESTDGSDSGD